MIVALSTGPPGCVCVCWRGDGPGSEVSSQSSPADADSPRRRPPVHCNTGCRLKTYYGAIKENIQFLHHSRPSDRFPAELPWSGAGRSDGTIFKERSETKHVLLWSYRSTYCSQVRSHSKHSCYHLPSKASPVFVC